MALLQKIDSNVTGLRYAEESSLGVLPGTPQWIPLEPNSYADFGGNLTLLARNPINPSRQRKKGVITDLDASGGFNNDLTQTNLQDMLQGFFFADLRKKGDAKNPVGDTTLTFSMTTAGAVLTRVGGTLDLTTLFAVGNLIFIQGFANAANNGLFRVGTVAATTIGLTLADGSGTTATVVTEAATPTVSVIKVGHEATAGDIDVDNSGSLPRLTSTTLNFTTLGLVPGEWVFVGGDAADNKFVTAANNGFKRVKSITATALTFDKSGAAMSTEASTNENIHIYIGRCLKNETGSLIKRRTYNLERTLGAPETTQPSQIQSEYLEGALPNELTLNIPVADKVNADLGFIATNFSQRSGVTGVKSGGRPALVESNAFNTSSDFSRIKMAVLSASNPAPTPLFAFLTELSLSINNNASPNKAVGVLGAFEVTAGTFQISGSVTAYFSEVAAITAVRDNANVTMDFAIVKANAGIVVDIPLIALGDGRASIEQDQPITLPLSIEAATGAGWDANMDHTLLMNFFDYLPNAADV